MSHADAASGLKFGILIGATSAVECCIVKPESDMSDFFAGSAYPGSPKKKNTVYCDSSDCYESSRITFIQIDNFTRRKRKIQGLGSEIHIELLVFLDQIQSQVQGLFIY